ncbi:hypothetical protein Herbaro_06450 [Herbaspirillum sp. WKF16]|uniref:hypothetical protein n=1 Tax=Herbaspirillum sp. WKF16 TaxID=3028312 RepID=UPI0023A951A0|nr:hypothetical protein [Herbaspirillum sp. WKF16]WDZ97426.1 hypothetical protein Herbaro_06450 [Herbaspirillum sp. WKF16]
MAYAATSAIGKSNGSWTHAAVAALPSTTRARRALHRASSFGSLLAFLLIDFSRFFFDQGDS